MSKQKKIASYLIGTCFALVLCISGIGCLINVDNTNAETSGGGGVTLNNPSIISAGSHNIAAIVNGKLFGWGSNNLGQIGNGTTIPSNTPVQASAATNWVSVSHLQHTLVLNSLGEIWASGYNSYGQIGDGTGGDGTHNNNKHTHVRVGTQTNWVETSVGREVSFALNSNGELWAWGHNNYGQLGIGTTKNSSHPVRVGNKSNWVKFSAGYESVFAINDMGELYAWGRNNLGQLGLGDTINRSSPTRVGTQTNWADISSGGWNQDGVVKVFSLAINSLGELYSWGWNGRGCLGLGDTVNRTSPTKVGTQNNWVGISASWGWHSLATNSKGELWTWGYNAYGQLGDGTTTQRNSPVKIGNKTNWVKVSGGHYHSHAINELGELYSWGYAHEGNLALGDTVDRHAPTKVPGTTFGYDVASPNSGDSYTVSAPSKTHIIYSTENYTFTITPNQGYMNPIVTLNSPNGVLSYSGVTEDGSMVIKISNVVGEITADDFIVSVSRV